MQENESGYVVCKKSASLDLQILHVDENLGV